MTEPKNQTPKPSKKAVRAELAKTGAAFTESLSLSPSAGVADSSATRDRAQLPTVADPNLVPRSLFPPVSLADALAAQAAVQPMLVANAYPLNNGFNFGT